ncbi:MAG TPA: hypothetical protein VEL73_03215 [Mycobacteriales bacterium]|nr:hypothetical protein [Mycobacteriales bacterium]
MRSQTPTILITAAMLLLAACTGGHGTGPGRAGSGSASPDSALSAQVSPPHASTTVVGERAPGALSLAVSRELFDSARAVVVAGAGDERGISTAAEQAKRLGVPLLLDDGTEAAAAALKAEIGRLKAASVLAVGAETSGRLSDPSGPPVVADPGQMSSPQRPDGLDSVAVLVRSGGDAATRAGAAAVTATATAAGAGVIAVRGADPRADPEAIAALAKRRPEQVLASDPSFGPVGRLSARLAVAATGRQLPGGGQVVLPGRRLVAMYGHPGTGALGVLGEQPVDAAIARAKRLAAPYRALSGSLPVVPAFEIIATVAQGGPGPDGDFSFEAPVSQLRPWVEKAGAAGLYVVLDLQPGRANFLDQAKRYEPLLTLPYVGLALDPEWRLAPNQRPLGQIGSASAREINSVYQWLADLTKRNTLPQKLFVLHQFRLSMIGTDRPLDRSRDEVALLIHMDGQGAPSLKDTTWHAVVGAAPKGVPFGWKNFYDEDKPMLTPAQTMSKRPTPVMISYQ